MDPVSDKHSNLWKELLEWVKVIVIALIISLPIRYFIAEPFIVNGASMDPAFSTSQFLIVDRVTYRFNEPKRGDVIVFKYPNDPSTYYIKRIIGLPGETLNIKNGKVILGKYDSECNTIENRSSAYSDCIIQTLDEPYVSSTHASNDTLTVTLKSTEYFVMGDNRAQSSDSRIWGPLDKSFIIGRPIVRLYPFDTLSLFPGEHHAYTQK